MLFSWNMVMAMNYFKTKNNDFNTGKEVISRTRQVAACGSIVSGFAFFAVTATRNAYLPYWLKRAPLFGFISFNAVAQLPTIMGFEQSPEKITRIGTMVNRIRKA